MRRLFQEFRYALRQMGKSPGFTFVVMITLALGIGATTSVFSVVDEVLLHPLAYPDSNRIVKVSQTFQGVWNDDASPANYLDWVAQNTVFAEMATSRGWPASLSAGGNRETRRGRVGGP